MSRLAVLWCRVTFRHRGDVGFIMGPQPMGGPFWMCNHCGEVLR